MTGIPSSVASLSEEWLVKTLVEQNRYEGGSIQSIKTQPMGEGIGQTGEFCKVLIRTHTGQEEIMFLKMRAPIEGMHQVALRYRMYENEMRFYKELAAKLEVRTPEVFYADYNSETESVALLMEFMEGWHSPDQISGASHEQASLAVKEISKISAPYWNRTHELPWLPSMKAEHLWATISDVKACEKIFYDRFGSELSISRDDFGNIIDSWPTILTSLSEGTLTLTHYDYRIENLFFSSNESEIAVIDWQLLASVRPSWDFTYLIVTNIDTDLRRTHQQEYIDLYLSGLQERGIDYSEAELREDMKWTLLGLSVIPVIGGSNFDAGNERSFELFKTIAVHHFETVGDFDALSVIA
jgi:aminoglycoside phosphotransferase (APT) family kinase protein